MNADMTLVVVAILMTTNVFTTATKRHLGTVMHGMTLARLPAPRIRRELMLVSATRA